MVCLLYTCAWGRTMMLVLLTNPSCPLHSHYLIDCKSWPSVEGFITYECCTGCMPLHEVTLAKKLSLAAACYHVCFHPCQKLLFLLLFCSNLAFVASTCLAHPPPSPSPPVFNYMYSHSLDSDQGHSCLHFHRAFCFLFPCEPCHPCKAFPLGFGAGWLIFSLGALASPFLSGFVSMLPYGRSVGWCMPQ